MDKFKRFLFIQLFLITLIVTFNLYYHYKYDFYGVFGEKKKILFSYDSFNLRVYKTEELLKSKNKFDSFLVGGSRFLAFDDKSLNKIGIGKFYNFSGIRSDMYDNYLQIEFLVKNFHVKNLILQIGVDDVFYFKDNSENIQRKSHYIMTGENILLYYFKFLFSFDLINLLKYILLEKYMLNNYSNNIDYNNFYMYDISEKIISEKGDDYFSEGFNDRRKKNMLLHPKEKIKDNLEYLKKIVQLSEKNDVKLIVFTAPLYIEYLDSLNQNDVKNYINELSKITSFWNFTTINSVTKDKTNFYEYIHYRRHVASWIVAKIYNDSTEYVPDDFGKYIEKAYK